MRGTFPDVTINGLLCFAATDYVKQIFTRHELSVLGFGSCLTRAFMEEKDLDTDFKFENLWRIPYTLLPEFDDFLRDHRNQERAYKAVRAIKAINARKSQAATPAPAPVITAPSPPPVVLEPKIWVITYRHPGNEKLRFHKYKTPTDADKAMSRWRKRGCTIVSRAAIIQRAA
jgi:hypothetical protein